MAPPHVDVHMHLLSAILIALVLLTVPQAAAAQAPSTNAPPGNSAIDEYLETVPGATGNQSPRSPSDGTEPGRAALTRAQRERLERAGPDGEALANLVDATSPAAKSSQSDEAAAATEPGRSPVGEVVGAATGQGGGGGMGFVLPAILLASLLGVIAVVVMQRRSST